MSATFDAQAYLNALERPVFIDPTGKRHVGRIIGADTWLKLQTRLRAPVNAAGEVDHRAFDRALKAIAHAFFPHPWWKIWKKSVAYWLFQLPPFGRMQAVWGFTRVQAKAMGLNLDQFPGTSLTSTPQQADVLPEPPTSGSLPSSMSISPVSTTSGATAG